MKILIIQFMSRGGIQLYTSQLANALAETEDVHMLLGSYLIKEDYYNKNVKLISFNSSPSYLKMMLSSLNPLTYYRIYRIIESIRPDVIHISYEFLWESILLQFIKKYPVVLTEHNPALHNTNRTVRSLLYSVYTGISKKLAARRANAIIVHGEKMKEILIEKGIQGSKIHVIPHGDFSFYTKWKKDDVKENNSVLFFGIISDYKGIEYLIKAEPLITSSVPDPKIIIAGSGDFRKYQGLIKNGNRFEIINKFIPDEEVAELFQKCGMVVLPYVNASQTGVIPIAYSFKKPVIVTSVGSLSEVVDDGKTGIVVPPRDEKALAEAIITLLKDENLRKRMGENAHNMMLNDLSWSQIAKKTIDIYNKISLKDHTSV